MRINRFRRAVYHLSFSADVSYRDGIVVKQTFSTLFQHGRKSISREELKSVIAAELRMVAVCRVRFSSIVFRVDNIDGFCVVRPARLVRQTVAA